MGLRQSKRSAEEGVVVVAYVKSQDELKTPVEAPTRQNGDAKSTERAELETTTSEDVKDKSITEESKVDVVKDEKKEKVKKKRSFLSFSFLQLEKKTKEENNKNGDLAKEKTEEVAADVTAAAVAEAVAQDAPAADAVKVT